MKVLILLTSIVVCVSAAVGQNALRVFNLDAKQLVETKKKIAAGDAKLVAAAKEIEAKGDRTLRASFQSVTTKSILPPSGNKKDYMSQAPYFWKNPETKDGFPYIRRDGERNPEIEQLPDAKLMGRMIGGVEDLARAYFVSGKEAYAAKATEIMRMWFIDEKTAMNPNLDYAQAIPGRNTGRGIGIIESRGLTRVVDSVGLLAGSKSWTTADQKATEQWFAAYLEWLLESKNGRDEADEPNNHGTYYDVQVASFALFTGQKELARKTLENAKTYRLAKQIEPDGSQPHELARTRSWDYSTMNLDGFVMLAELGDAAGVDLWSFRTKDGRGIRGAIDYLYPFATGEKKWTHRQLDTLRHEKLFWIIRRASRGYKDAAFVEMEKTALKSVQPSVF